MSFTYPHAPTPPRRVRKTEPPTVWERKILSFAAYVKHGNIFDDKDRLFHPWLNGCGIHQGFATLNEARDFALAYVKYRMAERLQTLAAEAVLLSEALRVELLGGL